MRTVTHIYIFCYVIAMFEDEFSPLWSVLETVVVLTKQINSIIKVLLIFNGKQK